MNRQDEKERRRQERLEHERWEQHHARDDRNFFLKFFATFSVATIAINVVYFALLLVVALAILKAFGVL